MKPGQLVLFNPRYPSPRKEVKQEIVMLLSKDGVGFKSEILLGSEKLWVRNSDLYDLLDADTQDPDIL